MTRTFSRASTLSFCGSQMGPTPQFGDHCSKAEFNSSSLFAERRTAASFCFMQKTRWDIFSVSCTPQNSESSCNCICTSSKTLKTFMLTTEPASWHLCTPLSHRRTTSKRGWLISPPVFQSTRRLPNGVSPNQLPHPPTRARAATGARWTTGQSAAASVRTGVTESSVLRKRRRRNGTERRRRRGIKRRRGRGANGRRGQNGPGSRTQNDQKSPVRKNELGRELGLKLTVWTLAGRRGHKLVANAPLLLFASNTVNRAVVFGWKSKDWPGLTHRTDGTDLIWSRRHLSRSPPLSLSLSLLCLCENAQSHRRPLAAVSENCPRAGWRFVLRSPGQRRRERETGRASRSTGRLLGWRLVERQNVAHAVPCLFFLWDELRLYVFLVCVSYLLYISVCKSRHPTLRLITPWKYKQNEIMPKCFTDLLLLSPLCPICLEVWPWKHVDILIVLLG